jgi:hypothetical protein
MPKVPKVVNNKEFSKNLEKRTRQFAVRIIRFSAFLKRNKSEYDECPAGAGLALFTSVGKGTEL